jgi:hypothetical protein
MNLRETCHTVTPTMYGMKGEPLKTCWKPRWRMKFSAQLVVRLGGRSCWQRVVHPQLVQKGEFDEISKRAAELFWVVKAVRL